MVHQWQFRFPCPSTGSHPGFSPGVSTSIRFDSLYPLVGLSGQWFALGSHFSCGSKKSFCFFSCLERASLESFNQRNNVSVILYKKYSGCPMVRRLQIIKCQWIGPQLHLNLLNYWKKSFYMYIFFTNHISCFEMQGTSGSYQAVSCSKASQDILHWVPGNLGRFLPDWELKYPQVDIQGRGLGGQESDGFRSNLALL